MKFKNPQGPSLSPGLQKGEKMKLIAMSIGLVLVIGAFMTSNFYRGKHEAAEEGELPVMQDEAPEITQTNIRLPEIDAAALHAVVSDTEEGEQVEIAPEALQLIGRWSRGLTDAQFRALNLEEWTPALDAELLAQPEVARGRALRFRGGIQSVRRHTMGEGLAEGWIATLRLDDGSIGHALVHDIPEGYRSIASWLRLDGLYLQRYRAEVQGEFVEGPLIVAPQAVPSYPPVGPVMDPSAQLADVRDDGVEQGTSGLPFGPYWALMSHAQLARSEELAENVDWDNVPELNMATLEQLVHAGEEWRGLPVRVPVSKLMDARVKRAPENPARQATLSEGWIGNTTWKNVVSFSAPFETELNRGDLVSARAFFFKNLAYEPREGGLRVAPRLVLVSLDEYVEPESPLMRYLFVGASAGTVLLVGAISLLIARDRRSSERMRQDMIRRRRERQTRVEAGSQASA